MSIEIRIPKLGVTMSEATLRDWLVEDGATVAVGSPIYALEMDKSANEVESPAAGRITLIGRVDEVYEVGALIATID